MAGKEFQLAIAAALHAAGSKLLIGYGPDKAVRNFLLRECVCLAFALWADVFSPVATSQMSGGLRDKVGTDPIMDDTLKSQGLDPNRVKALDYYRVEHIEKTDSLDMGYSESFHGRDEFSPPSIHEVSSQFINRPLFRDFVMEANWWIHLNLLHLAIDHLDLRWAELLLHWQRALPGRGIDQVDNHGDTALCLAVRRCNLTGARFLVDHGACTGPVDFEDGWKSSSPLKVAEEVWRAPGQLLIFQRMALAEIVMCMDPLVESLSTGIFEESPTQLPPGVVYLFNWDLPTVISSLVGLGPEPKSIKDVLRNYVILTGSDSRFSCLTCAEYVDNRWGEPGTLVLEVICEELENGEQLEPFMIRTLSGKAIMIDISAYHLTIHCPNKQAEDANFHCVLQVVYWLTSAIRKQPVRVISGNSGDLFGSRLRINSWLLEPDRYSHTHHGGVYQIIPEPFETLTDLEIGESRCWANMFNSGIVTWSDMRSTRDWGRGLQIDFSLLVHLTAVGTYYMFKKDESESGGVILVGFRSALIPISEKDGAIQWHFALAKEGQTINIRAVMEQLGGRWHKVQDPRELERAKLCFVGWHEKAEILLGTKDGQYTLDQSDSTELAKTLKLSGVSFGVTGGLSGGPMAPISLGAQATAQYVLHSFEQRFKPNPEYEMALNTISPQVAFLYDTGASRAWLVPGLSLHLHLCHEYFFRNKDNWGAKTNHIPYADVSTNGSLAAIRALREGRDVHVFQDPEDSDHDPSSRLPPNKTTLLHVFQMVHLNLVQSNDAREPFSISRPWPFLTRVLNLTSAELGDMLGTPNMKTSMKQVEILAKKAAPWHSLADSADIVFVCSNIGHPIRPVPSWSTADAKKPLKCECCELPRGEYYLAAHTWCLRRILEKKKWIRPFKSPTSTNGLGENHVPSPVPSDSEPFTYYVDEEHWALSPTRNGGWRHIWRVCHHATRSIWDSPEGFFQDFSLKVGKQLDRENGGRGCNKNQIIPNTGVLVFGDMEF